MIAAAALALGTLVCHADVASAMGPPPHTCTELQNVKLLEARLVNLTSPAGTNVQSRIARRSLNYCPMSPTRTVRTRED